MDDHHLCVGQAIELRGAADSHERQENRWLLAHILQVNAGELLTLLHHPLELSQQQAYLDALNRLRQGEPLAYVLGTQPFWTLDLVVTPDTLVPRPDSEVLVERALQLNLPERAVVVDLGTGTGALALALASERPDWQVTATDCHAATLAVAQQNAQRHGLQQVEFMLSDWYRQLSPLAGQVDLIVSNPPYIAEHDPHLAELVHEPRRALVASDQGLADLQVIIQDAGKFLKTGGWLMVEHGHNQGQVVRELFEQHGFEQVQTVQDYGQNDRISYGQWFDHN